MDVEIIDKVISVDHLKEVAKQRFGDMVKAVVDIKKKIIVIGGELHADEEALLLDQGSDQEDLWGINIYVDEPRESWIEFDSMINIRPSRGNRSRGIEDVEMRDKIIKIVDKLVT